MSGGSISLLATGIVGVVNFVMTIPAVMFVDQVGRRPMLIWGELNMAISHAAVAAIVATYGPEWTNKAAGNGAVFMIYWYISKRGQRREAVDRGTRQSDEKRADCAGT